MRSKIEAYPLERSPWVGLGTQRAFARLVRIPLKELKSLAAHREDCYWTQTKIIGDKERNIACPIKKMRELHETLKRFFNRIQQPEYLYSPRRKHTAIMNAVLHQTGRVVVKLDIRQFYPKTTDEHVFRFLHHQLNMPDDVAGLITKLVTFEKKLPFGSPLSPVLCTLVHRDMFDRIHGYCALEDHTLSIWVDDLTISGLDRKDALTKAIRREIARKGLETHKLQRRRIKRGMVITGIYISNDTIAPSNKTHVKIRDKLQRLSTTDDPEEKLKLVQSLIGSHNHCLMVYPADSPQALQVKRRKAWLHQKRRELEKKIKYRTEMAKSVLSSSELEAPSESGALF